MYPHTKFEIPTSKNLGDMHWTRSGTDGRTEGRTDGGTDGQTDGQCNYYMPPKVPLGGIKNRTQRYIDILQDAVYSYNRTIHRSLGKPPANFTKDNEGESRL